MILRQTEKMAMADVAWLKRGSPHRDDGGQRRRGCAGPHQRGGVSVYKSGAAVCGGFDRLDYESIWDLGMKAGENNAVMERHNGLYIAVSGTQRTQYSGRTGQNAPISCICIPGRWERGTDIPISCTSTWL